MSLGLVGAKDLFNIIWSILRYCIPLTIMLITFSLIYQYVPNRRLKFNNVIVGTIFTTVGWVTTSLLFSFYVNSFANYEKVYGSLGGVIALISWLYISTLIILIGGELNSINFSFKNKEKIKKNDSTKLNEEAKTMSMIIMKDGTQIYYKDWGTGQPVLFSHGWPLNSDSWEAQMLFLSAKGYRCIAHDRRGHGRSSQPYDGNNMDTYADDLSEIIETLDLKNIVLVGFSAGGGEVARYIGRHGTETGG